MELLHQIHLERTADTAVLQRHQTIIFCADYAAFLNQVGIDVHLAYVVHNHRKTNPFAIGKNTIEKRCLTATQIPRE